MVLNTNTNKKPRKTLGFLFFLLLLFVKFHKSIYNKNMKKKGLFYFFGLILLTCAMLTPFSLKKNNLSTTFAESTSIKNTIDLFIKKPTFSTYYNEKIYFVDDADKLLKIYDLESETFDSKYISLKDYSSIIEAVSVDNYFVLIASKKVSDTTTNVLVFINLDTKELSEFSSDEISVNHDKIYVEKLALNEQNTFLVTLSSNDYEKADSMLFILNQTTLDELHHCKIKLTNHEDIANSLFKVFVTQTSDEDEFNIIIFYSWFVAYGDISLSQDIASGVADISSIAGFTIKDLDGNNIYLHNSIPDTDIASVNLINISGTPHFVVTYIDKGKTESYIPHFYYFYIGSSTNTEFTLTDYFRTTIDGKTLTNNNYVIYSHGQTITYMGFECVSPLSELEQRQYNIIDEGTIKNPDIEFAYYSNSDFVYKHTKQELKLLKTPWDFEENAITTIPANTDIVCVGYAQIAKSQIKINDYSYCLYTADNKNYVGLIEDDSATTKTLVENKPIIDKDAENYEYTAVVTVYEGTPLYSLPSTATNVLSPDTGISGSLTFAQLDEIKAQTKVTIVDAICGYVSNNSKMIKVEANGTVGFINCKDIYPKSEVIEYIETNSFIKKDGTKVYSSANSNSSPIDILKKDKDIFIDGKRDTKTGFTYIVYNDEYGNVLSGYIQTDYLETNSWSLMQIIGCILIAINTGLLILILVFKKKHIGKDGQKYVDNKKPNYKEH